MLAGDFSTLYSPMGRLRSRPEKLLRAMLLQSLLFNPLRASFDGAVGWTFFSVGFVGIGVDDAAWDHSVFSKNRDRLLDGDIAAKFLSAVLAQPTVKKLLSTDHFSVDGTLIEAWASMKSVRPKDCSG